ncbi:50S ribosomal protein L22 [Candidatus Woesearchaeota archaeon]|nr:50S ribosomal protein L22 [Candidatus Woesearchaeota archaeon]
MNYSTPLGKQDACAWGNSLSISTKVSVEICRALRNKQYTAAKQFLNNVLQYKEPVPYLRYKHNIGHRRGPIGAGRYPQKASKDILSILESAAANAANKGLAVGNLIIKHISAHRGPRIMRQGRNYRRAKRTHIEIILTEQKQEKKPAVKETKKDIQKEAKT